MTDRDEYLRNVTYKGGAFDVAQRVSHMLLDVDERRRAKALAWLGNHLHKKEILTVDDIDELLFATRPVDE